MEQQALYKKLATYYDQVYGFKDYKKEASKLNKLIVKLRKSKGKKLLDVACGTGTHVKFLSKKYNCTGIDLNEEMLEVAREKADKVKFKKGDMTTFKLEETFDVIMCVFGSIAYLKTLPKLQQAISNFAEHLNPGGVLILEPFLTPKAYKVGFPHMTTYVDEDLIIARQTVSKLKGNSQTIAIMDMHYLIAERDKKVNHYIDRHEVGLFRKKEILSAMEKAGFKAKYSKDGFMNNRGLFWGVAS